MKFAAAGILAKYISAQISWQRNAQWNVSVSSTTWILSQHGQDARFRITWEAWGQNSQTQRTPMSPTRAT
eukprot:9217598-Karenia_brevis.AAC.1